jgi:hypothetical protein
VGRRYHAKCRPLKYGRARHDFPVDEFPGSATSALYRHCRPIDADQAARTVAPLSFSFKIPFGSMMSAREVTIPPLGLDGTLNVPAGAHSLVAFVHGSGSSRTSPRNIAVATALSHRGVVSRVVV